MTAIVELAGSDEPRYQGTWHVLVDGRLLITTSEAEVNDLLADCSQVEFAPMARETLDRRLNHPKKTAPAKRPGGSQ